MQIRLASLSSLTLALAGLLLTSCGGGGGSSAGVAPLPPLSSVQIATSTGSIDGFVTSAQAAYGGTGLEVGDQELSVSGFGGARSFVSFDHPQLPLGATVQSVVLRVYVVSVLGSPHVTHGPLIASHVNIGDTLEIGEFSSGVLQFNIGQLADDATLGWKELDVTSLYTDDVLSGRTRSQFRLLFQNLDYNNNGDDDLVIIEDGENSLQTANIPELVITYLDP